MERIELAAADDRRKARVMALDFVEALNRTFAHTTDPEIEGLRAAAKVMRTAVDLSALAAWEIRLSFRQEKGGAVAFTIHAAPK